MISSVLKTISNSLTGILISIILLLLAAMYWQNSNLEDISKELEDAVYANGTLTLVNASLNMTITTLKEEIVNMPNKYIEVTREVDSELCKGTSSIEQVLNLDKPTVEKRESPSENNYIDIDGKLPPSLLRLLQ